MSCPHLTKDDRISLGALLKVGLSIRECARQIGFSPPAVSKEIARNGGRDKYSPYQAHKRYLSLRKEVNQCHRILGSDNFMTDMVVTFLEFKYSPEQIVGRLEFETGDKLISVASIYNYANPIKEIANFLPRKHNKYRRRKDGNQRKQVREELSNKNQLIPDRRLLTRDKEPVTMREIQSLAKKERLEY